MKYPYRLTLFGLEQMSDRAKAQDINELSRDMTPKFNRMQAGRTWQYNKPGIRKMLAMLRLKGHKVSFVFVYDPDLDNKDKEPGLIRNRSWRPVCIDIFIKEYLK